MIDAAAQLDRKVALVGRSMRKNFNIASNLGIANSPKGIFIQPREIENFPDEKVVVISTGSQGEPLSALRRMANNDHRDVQLHSGDTVVFSATPVPGNERAVNETIDRIYEIGATVDHRQGRADPRLRPRLAGGAEADAEPDPAEVRDAGPRRLPAAAAARRAGRSGRDRPGRIFQGRNGLPFEVSADGAGFGEDVHAGVMYVDGVNIGDPDDAALRDRREISADGIFIVVATISSDDGSVVADPEVIFRGVAFLEEADSMVEDLRDLVEDQLDDAANAGKRENHLVEEDLHDAIGKFVWQRLKRRADGPAGRDRGLSCSCRIGARWV